MLSFPSFRVLRIAVLASVLLTVGGIGSHGWAQSPNPAPSMRSVQVSGEGTARAEPDQALVRFGVETQADDAETARAQNAEASSRAMNAVRALDVPENKIRMASMQLQPRREWNPKAREYEDKGYEARRQVVVELDDLSVLPTLVTRVVQEGANRLNGIEYTLSDRDPVRNQALQDAAESAREKAELLAQSLGARLGAVQQIQEQNFDFPRPVFAARMEMAKTADRAAPEPDAYAAGEIEVTATVQVTFALQ